MIPTPARMAFASAYVDGLVSVLGDLPVDQVACALQVIEEAFRRRSTIFLAGNGGSAATASHMANDLVWGVGRLDRLGCRAIALADAVPTATAIGNDVSFAEVFAVQLRSLARAHDLLIVISASGNSPNILKAIDVAQAHGMKTVGFLGMGGGAAAAMVDVAVVVPAADYGPTEDVHLALNHLVMSYLRSLKVR